MALHPDKSISSSAAHPGKYSSLSAAHPDKYSSLSAAHPDKSNFFRFVQFLIIIRMQRSQFLKKLTLLTHEGCKNIIRINKNLCHQQ